MVQPVVDRRIERDHAVGVDRRNSLLHGDAHEMIHEPVLGDEGRARAVRGEHEARGESGGVLERREQRLEVGPEGGLPQHDRDPGAGPLQGLLGGDGLVAGGNPHRGEPLELLGRGSRRMPLDPLSPRRRQGEPLQNAPIALQGLGPARDLPHRRHARVVQETGERTDGKAPRLAVRAGLGVHARPPVEPERQASQRADGRLETAGAGELVDGQVVGEDGRRAERQDVAGEDRRRDEVPRVGVGLDVAGAENPAAGRHDFGARPDHIGAAPHVGDPLPLDRHVGGVALPGIDVEERPVPDVAIGRGVPPRHGGEGLPLLDPAGRPHG